MRLEESGIWWQQQNSREFDEYKIEKGGLGASRFPGYAVRITVLGPGPGAGAGGVRKNINSDVLITVASRFLFNFETNLNHMLP